MTNDLYVNARGNILLIAFKITIILGAHVGWGSWELELVGVCDGGVVMLKVRLGPYSLGHINQ